MYRIPPRSPTKQLAEEAEVMKTKAKVPRCKIHPDNPHFIREERQGWFGRKFIKYLCADCVWGSWRERA